MRDYIIVTDATSDIPNEMANELNVKVVPMSFSLGEKNYNHYRPVYSRADMCLCDLVFSMWSPVY